MIMDLMCEEATEDGRTCQPKVYEFEGEDERDRGPR